MTGPVIAICGPPGAGKSTLSRGLAQRLRARLIEHDEFETFTRAPLPMVRDWIERGAPYAEVTAPGLPEALAKARSNGPVVYDTPLGRGWPSTAASIDVAVWIEVPLDIALARKIEQLSAQVPEPDAPSFVGWLRGYMAEYGRITAPACAIQRTRVAPTCDVTIDGNLGKDAQLAAAVSSLRKITEM